MRLLADECCPARIVEGLRQTGHDVTYIREFMRAADDLAVAAQAQADDRVLITEDYDFGELVVRHGVRLPGLIILAMPDKPGPVALQRVLELTAKFGDSLRDQITLVEPGRERVRPFAFE